MTNPLRHVGQTAHPEGAEPSATPLSAAQDGTASPAAQATSTHALGPSRRPPVQQQQGGWMATTAVQQQQQRQQYQQ